jgi:2-keto-4-pentenoate hydratase/2-oxohepta-3-ene-1,7-dioic acid hydratase in catechol pathway
VADDGSLPPIFAKFPSSLAGPDIVVALPEGDVDWEVELAVVVGRTARNVAEEDAWGHVAGVTVAQDLSERRLQFAGPSPQFGLAKSYPGFLPLGPWVVTPDELDDPDAVPLSATLNGEVVQDGSTRDLVCAVAPLIARLSRIVPLVPGDVLLTGTPAGVGMARTPPRFLAPGDVLESTVAGVGSMRQRFVAATELGGGQG